MTLRSTLLPITNNRKLWKIRIKFNLSRKILCDIDVCYQRKIIDQMYVYEMVYFKIFVGNYFVSKLHSNLWHLSLYVIWLYLDFKILPSLWRISLTLIRTSSISRTYYSLKYLLEQKTIKVVGFECQPDK